MSIVNKTELSEILGKSERTITTWQKNGMPILADGVRGAANSYETEEVIDWLIDREIKNRIKNHGGDEEEFFDYEVERARLTYHNANIAGLEEQVRRGDLRPTEEVEREWTELVMNCRAKLLSVPTKSAHQLVGVTDLVEAQHLLEELVHEALSELAHDTDYESTAEVCAAAET